VPVVGHPEPLHEFTGFPSAVLMAKVPVTELLAVALKTSGALVVYGGGGPPLPCPEVGMVHVDMVNGLEQEEGGAGASEPINVSVPKLPVSVVPFIKRFPVVLG
jgi:hypothetical protein